MPALRPIQSKTLPNCTQVTILPDAEQQAEFTRQLKILVNQHKSYPSIGTWVSNFRGCFADILILNMLSGYL